MQRLHALLATGALVAIGVAGTAAMAFAGPDAPRSVVPDTWVCSGSSGPWGSAAPSSEAQYPWPTVSGDSSADPDSYASADPDSQASADPDSYASADPDPRASAEWPHPCADGGPSGRPLAPSGRARPGKAGPHDKPAVPGKPGKSAQPGKAAQPGRADNPGRPGLPHKPDVFPSGPADLSASGVVVTPPSSGTR